MWKKRSPTKNLQTVSEAISRGGMSGWNDGGRSEKGNNEEEKKRCLTGILNCKGVDDQLLKAFPVGPDLGEDLNSQRSKGWRKLVT